MHYVVRASAAIQYQGTPESADEVLAAAQSVVQTGSTWAIDAADSSGMTLRETTEWGESYAVMQTGQWLIMAPIGITDLLDNDAFPVQYRVLGGDG